MAERTLEATNNDALVLAAKSTGISLFFGRRGNSLISIEKADLPQSLELLDQIMAHSQTFNGTTYAAYLMSGVYGSMSEQHASEQIETLVDKVGLIQKVRVIYNGDIRHPLAFLSPAYDFFTQVFNHGLDLLVQGEKHLGEFMTLKYKVFDMEQRDTDKYYWTEISIPKKELDAIFKKDRLKFVPQGFDDEIEIRDLGDKKLEQYSHRMNHLFEGARVTTRGDNYVFYTYSSLPGDLKKIGKYELNQPAELAKIPILQKSLIDKVK